MFNFAIVGDPHLNYKTPMSRIDDYPATCIAKLNSIRLSCKKEEVNTVILLGDIFNTSKQSIQFLNKIIETFYEFVKDGITVYSIVGNHDISFEKMETLDKSPLQTLFASGCIQHLKHLKFSNKTAQGPDVLITGFDYPDEITKAQDNKLFNVCFAHRYYEYELSDQFLRKEDLDFLDYKLYVFGHDHMPYQNIKGDKWILHRPGSMTRGTANEYNKQRDCCFTIATIPDDCSKVNFKKIPIDCLKPEFVFSEKVMIDSNKRPDKTDSQVFESLISDMEASKKTDRSDVYSILDSLDCSQRCRETIIQYFESNGLFRPVL